MQPDLRGFESLPDLMKLDKWLYDLGICESVSEARRLIKQGGISLNKEKVSEDIEHIYIHGEKFYLSTVDLSKVNKLEHNGEVAYYLEN